MFPMFSILNLIMYFLNLISSTNYSLETYPFRKVGTIGNTPVSYSNLVFRFEMFECNGNKYSFRKSTKEVRR